MSASRTLLLLPLLAGCATARLYSQQELGSIGERCGYALGEVAQEADEKRILLVMTAVPTSPAQQQCIYRWAHPRRLHVAFIQIEQAP